MGAKIPLWWDEVPHCPANEGMDKGPDFSDCQID